MSMMRTYDNITARPEQAGKKSVIENSEFTVMAETINGFNKDILPYIPAGAVIKADSAGPGGMFGMTEIDGILYRVLVPIDELHNIDFGKFDARKKETEK